MKKIESKPCLICLEDPTTKHILYKDNVNHVRMINEYIEAHLFVHSNHESMIAEWNKCCGSFGKYTIKLKDKKN